MRVREARPDERGAALNVLDAAMLATDGLDGATLLVAVEDDRVLGALALVGERVRAVAVRRRRRGQGVGTTLVRAAGRRTGRLVAEFDADRRPFYESLGFDVEPVEPAADGTERTDRVRCRGVRVF
jgi:GNAT superfamily N-acetyltransferase